MGPFMKLEIKTIAAICALAFSVLLGATVPAHADDSHTEMVQFPKFDGAKGTVSGFLATPAKAGRYGAIVVASEWWGLTDWIKEQTRKLAAEGYVVLAVDFYDGKVTSDATEAGELSGALTQETAITDLQAALQYLLTRQDVNRSYVGAVGWGMGAGYILRMAMRESRLAALVVNYGPLPTDPNDVQVIVTPLLGNFGAQDHGVTAADARAFEKLLKSMKRQVDIKIYDGAGHAFENPASGSAYDPEAAADAWSRTIAFLGKTMK
jgi:carboxymethylenebutenolidase